MVPGLIQQCLFWSVCVKVRMVGLTCSSAIRTSLALISHLSPDFNPCVVPTQITTTSGEKPSGWTA